jgi:integrase
MAHLRKLANGNVRADVRMKGVLKNKTFPSETLALAWAEKLEYNIRLIPVLDRDQLSALTDDEIANMGGADLFLQLGVDIESIRNQAKIEAINALNKSQLLALSMQEIDKMGGVELFLSLYKRIRYKTFNQVCEEYLASWKKKDYVGQMQRTAYWCSLWGERMITDIDVFDVQDHIDTLIKEKVRASTIIRKKAVLSGIFNFAVSKSYVDNNFIPSIIIDNDTINRERVLSAEERNKLIDACKISSWNRLYLLVLMAMTTGARRGELLKLKWKDVSFNEHIAHIIDSKIGTNREIHLIKTIMDELNRFKSNPNELIFSSKRKPNKPFNFRKVFSKALMIAKISEIDVLDSDGFVVTEKFTFHCLRHGFCTQLSDSGKELSQIAKMAGHKSLQTTMRYIKQDKNQKRQITNELAQAFGL